MIVSAGTTTRSCGKLYVRDFYRSIEHIRATHVTCRTARVVARGYVRAISATTSASGTRQGACFPQQSYGLCRFSVAGQNWSCNRPLPSRSVPSPTTRCRLGLGPKLVRFSWR